MKAPFLMWTAVGLLFGLPAIGKAELYTFSTINYPGAASTEATGINDGGQIVGRFDGERGYLLSGGTFSTIDFPGAQSTYPRGINSAGQIVGNYVSAGGNDLGFLLSGGTFSTIQFPGSLTTDAYAINSIGQIVGTYVDAGGVAHGYLFGGGFFSTIDFPGAKNTEVHGINDLVQIVGTFTDASVRHGFLLSGGTFSTFDFPGSLDTVPLGINNAGEIVGTYLDAASVEHGFLLSGGRSGPSTSPALARPWLPGSTTWARSWDRTRMPVEITALWPRRFPSRLRSRCSASASSVCSAVACGGERLLVRVRSPPDRACCPACARRAVWRRAALLNGTFSACWPGGRPLPWFAGQLLCKLLCKALTPPSPGSTAPRRIRPWRRKSRLNPAG